MPSITTETTLTDRELLLHLLQHAEEQTRMVQVIYDELEIMRPLLARFRPPGGADMLTVMQTARDLRRSARRTDRRN